MNYIREFKYSGFNYELEILPGTHSHTIRRESGVILRDEYALRMLKTIDPYCEQTYLQHYARSWYDPALHVASLMKYGDKDLNPDLLNQLCWNAAVEAIRTDLNRLQRVRAYDVLTELDQISYESASSAGYDYHGSKGPLLCQTHKRAISRAKATVLDVYDRTHEGLKHAIETHVPDVSYTRTQLSNIHEKIKVRGVWGRAFHYILLEGSAARPLMDMFTHNRTFFHIGSDPTISVPETIYRLKEEYGWLIAIDWSGFDATVSRFEIETGFNLIKPIIDFPNEQTETAFELSKHLFMHKKIAAPDGKIYWSHRGIPSGSYYTMLLGSIVNRLRIEYLWRLITGEGPSEVYTQGDDSLTGAHQALEMRIFAKEAEQLGWHINADKSVQSMIPEEIEFLGRSCRGGLHERAVDKCLRLLIYPEHEVENGRISAYRATALNKDCGYMSSKIEQVARMLHKRYGTAAESEVPNVFKRYVP